MLIMLLNSLCFVWGVFNTYLPEKAIQNDTAKYLHGRHLGFLEKVLHNTHDVRNTRKVNYLPENIA